MDEESPITIIKTQSLHIDVFKNLESITNRDELETSGESTDDGASKVQTADSRCIETSGNMITTILGQPVNTGGFTHNFSPVPAYSTYQTGNNTTKNNSSNAKRPKRAGNWNFEEKLEIYQLVKEFGQTVDAKTNDVDAMKQKSRAWDEIYRRFSAKFGNSRDFDRVKQQWRRMKVMAKKRCAEQHKLQMSGSLLASSTMMEEDGDGLPKNSLSLDWAIKRLTSRESANDLDDFFGGMNASVDRNPLEDESEQDSIMIEEPQNPLEILEVIDPLHRPGDSEPIPSAFENVECILNEGTPISQPITANQNGICSTVLPSGDARTALPQVACSSSTKGSSPFSKLWKEKKKAKAGVQMTAYEEKMIQLQEEKMKKEIEIKEDQNRFFMMLKQREHDLKVKHEQELFDVDMKIKKYQLQEQELKLRLLNNNFKTEPSS